MSSGLQLPLVSLGLIPFRPTLHPNPIQHLQIMSSILSPCLSMQQLLAIPEHKLAMQDVAGDSGHLAPRDPPGNAAATPKASPGGGTATPTASTPSSPARPSAYRSMSDTRVKKFDKLLGEQVVSPNEHFCEVHCVRFSGPVLPSAAFCVACEYHQIVMYPYALHICYPYVLSRWPITTTHMGYPYCPIHVPLCAIHTCHM